MAVKDLRANSERIFDFDEQIKLLNNRKKKLMEQNKQTVYDILAELYGKQNQELVDAVSAELHNSTLTLLSCYIVLKQLKINSKLLTFYKRKTISL